MIGRHLKGQHRDSRPKSVIQYLSPGVKNLIPNSRWAALKFLAVAGLAGLLAACAHSPIQLVDEQGSATTTSNQYDQYQIVTLLPRDGIQAIDDPKFMSAVEADESYEPQERILGVEFNGDARAYSVPFLSSHEIVNDKVGGVAIAVTW